VSRRHSRDRRSWRRPKIYSRTPASVQNGCGSSRASSPSRIGEHPLPIRGNCFPLGGHPLPRKPSETGTDQLGTRFAPFNRHRCVEWLTRQGAGHVVRAGFQHRALRSWVRGHGSRSEDALATTRVRETLAMHYDRYGRTLNPTRRARRVQRGRLQRGRRTPRVPAPRDNGRAGCEAALKP
jgi:hypothetical protein